MGALCVAGALGVVACGNAATDSETSTSRAPLWTLEGPTVRIGSVDDAEFAFSSVSAMAEGPDGSVYSLHFAERAVRRWSPDGTPAGTIGREGEGPGEFTNPRRLGFFGDSLWVMDGNAYRVSYFDSDGAFLGSVSPSVDLGGADGIPPRPTIPLRDGTFHGRGPAVSHLIATGELTSTSVVLMDATGATIANTWRRPHEPRDILALLNDDGIGGTFGVQPFGDGVLSTVTERGIVVVERRAWTGEGPSTFTVTAIAHAGDTLASRPFDYEPEALPASRLDSLVTAQAADMHRFMSRFRPGLAIGAIEEDIGEAVYRPAYVPPVESVKVAMDGSVWLERHDGGDDDSEWWILDSGLDLVRRALVPPGLTLHLIGDDYVWGVETDDLDVNYIVRYRLGEES